MKSGTRDIVISALGRARMEPYLMATGDNKKKALALYRWSVMLTASIQETLGLTEVILRNAIDNKLQDWNNIQQGETTSWLLHEPASPLRSLTQGKRTEALKRAKKSAELRPSSHPRWQDDVTHDDVLAHTMFGMWKDILPNHADGADPTKTPNSNRMRLWEEALRGAFPHTNDPDGKKTYWHVTHIHGLRNRVSHMDSLLNVDVLDRINDAFTLVRSVDPVLAQWLTGTSTVSAVFSKKPW